MLEMAAARLDAFSDKVKTTKLPKVLDQDIQAHFDIVVSINAIHTMKDPAEAISILEELLTAEGRAYIVDPVELASFRNDDSCDCPVCIRTAGQQGAGQLALS